MRFELVDDSAGFEKEDIGIIEIDDAKAVIGMVNFDNRKRGIGDIPHFADRQRSDNRFHDIIERRLFFQHRNDDLRGQRGENAGFDAAAEAI